MLGIRALKSGRKAGIFIAVISAIVLLSMISADIHAQKPTKKIGVFVNRRDKKKTVGYTRFGLVWGQQFSPPRDLLRSVINLKEAMNKYTKIETDVDDHLELASGDLLKTPIIFLMSGDNVEVTPTELENLKKYVEMGGLIVVDVAQLMTRTTSTNANISLRKLLKDVIPNARFEPLSNSHELFHSFFDFDDGPPVGSEKDVTDPEVDSEEERTKIEVHRIVGSLKHDIQYIEGVYYKGRLAAIFSEKGYSERWNASSGNDPQLRMGVNMIVYSLIQEGGIASVY